MVGRINSRTFNPSSITLTRIKLNQTQMEFAFMLGISSKVLDSWERGVTQPEGPAKALLRVAEYHPNAFYKILKKREA